MWNTEPSEEQRHIIDHIKNNANVIVDAVAGSGKTTTVLWLARECPDKKILQITYNTALKNEVRKKVESLNLKNLEIQNYHSLACKFYNRLAYTDSVLRKVVLDDHPLKTAIPHYDIIVLDETQDMTPILYKLIVKFFKNMNKQVQLLILGDKHQSIYGFKDADERFLTLAHRIWDNYEFTFLPLHTSYRVTQPIASFVNEVMIGDDRMIAAKGGCPVKYVTLHPFEDEAYITNLVLDLLETGATFDDFFILVGSVRSSRAPYKKLENSLVSLGYPCYVATSDDTKIQDEDIKGKICFSTFHQSKGRERKYVMIYGFDESYFMYYGKDYDPYICPATLYVAVTRASEQLILLQSYDKKPLPFLKSDLFNKDYIDYVSLRPGRLQRIQPPLHKSSVIDLVRHLGENVINTLTPMVESTFNHTVISTNKVTLKSKITNANGLVEDVSELNGSTIPTIREARHNDGDNFMYSYIMKHSGRIKDEHPYIYEKSKKVKKECTKVWHYLFMANIYKSIRDSLYFKLAQIDKYDWLSWKEVDQCIDIIDKHVPTTDIKYEKDLGKDYDRLNKKYYSYSSPLYGNIDLYGTIDAEDTDTVWEFKCVDALTIDHFLQVVVYAWIWRQCDYDKKKFRLFNIRTGDIHDLDTSSYLINDMMNIIFDAKYGKPKIMDDIQFLEYIK
jgi:hypothetical protein